MSIYDAPHRRLNLLTGEWVLVSPHRARRPWLGQLEKTAEESLPAYDPTCYLCPGNSRVGGVKNPVYDGAYAFPNDFPALLRPDQAEVEAGGSNSRSPDSSGLFQAQVETGLCRVVCFSPRHDLTLPELSQAEVEGVVRAWTEQTIELQQTDFIRYVQVFENKGAVMGCSNPHPHSQIWASSLIPMEPGKELLAQQAYLKSHGECLLCSLLKAEQAAGQRIVCANEHFTALVPFWAVWPFEVMIVANRHVASLPELNADQSAGLADILRRMTARYDNIFQISFPYSMGFHQAPATDGPYPGWHLHAHYYPPLLRSATVRKFMVGYEMLAMPQRDLTPETAAGRLRELSEAHYKKP
jgi:UDPglucose--hexose-1-phosphate uridylyltransferase